MSKKKNKPKKLNNAGMTLTEMVVTFAILGLFMVAATRIISYTVDIYYASRGATYGLEVANMISNKVVGMMEGANSMPVIDENTGEVSFVDATGSEVVIGTVNKNGISYVNIHYKEANYNGTDYAAVDWQFDPKAYMGYEVQQLRFENPNGSITEESAKPYPDNVVLMVLVLNSEKYGTYSTQSYIKCANAK